MGDENLTANLENGCLLVTINRPQVLNALNGATLTELDDAVSRVECDAAVRACIITGRGDRSFVAGADIQELRSLTPLQFYDWVRTGQRILRRIELLTKPVVAAVNGYALGGGLELALSCHLRVAAEGARFGLPELRLGMIPGFGGTQRLARLIGKGRALDLLLTGRRMDAAEAFAAGLVNRVVPAAALIAAARALADEILRNSPAAIRLALEAVTRGLEMPLPEALEHEASLDALAYGGPDREEGIRAFLEKRTPRFGDV